MNTTLSSRERVNRAIERKPHDRVPRYESFWGDTMNRWEKEGLVGGQDAAREALQADLLQVVPFLWPSPYPGQQEVLSEDANTQTIRDQWGGLTRAFKDHQTTPTHLGWECDSKEIWEEKIKPNLLTSGMDFGVDVCLENMAKSEKLQKWGYYTTVEPFEMLRKLIGDEETMISIKEDPEWIRDMAVTNISRTLKDLQLLYDGGVRAEGLWIYGDMAYNHSTMCSPDDYKELIWPEHKRLCDWAHERGMKTIYHTDGNVNGVIDLYLEAGVDVLQPMECKAGMDIRNLVPKYGDQLSFFGNIDVMVLIRGDLEEIEAEIVSKFEAGKQKNGYIYHSDHSIPPQVSWPLYQEIIKLVEKHGDY